MKPEELREYSPITWILRGIFNILQNISLANILFKNRVQSQSGFENELIRIEFTKKRGKQIELYILLWLLVEISLITHHGHSSIYNYASVVIASYRIMDIMQASLNLNLFDRLKIKNTKQQLYISTLARTVILSVWNFFELALCFGLIYVSIGEFKTADLDTVDLYYFSFITQLTIGYGDICPKNFTRFIVIIQGCFSFIIGIIAISRIISFLPKNPTVFNDD